MVELLQLYREIQKDIQIIHDNKFSDLVHPSSTQQAPVHNWYHFKEGFSHNLLNNIIDHTKIQGEIKIFDPFCGSGTTLLSALISLKREDINVVSGLGIEVNPFIHFVAETKVNFHQLKMDRISGFVNYISSKNFQSNNYKLVIPELTTIKKAYTPNTLSQLIYLKDSIKNYFHESEYEYKFCLLAFASILEKVSCMRKSGRALKIVKEHQDYDVKPIFLEKLIQMINDVLKQKNNIKMFDLKVKNEDIRDFSCGNEASKYNLVVFSPPYLNHFDYTEVYKIELWMLDFISNYNEFRLLRYKTLRSHPSVKFEDTHLYSNFGSSAIKNIVDSLITAEKKEPFYKTIRDYIDDMYKTLIRISSLTPIGSTIACVVANSLFGSKSRNNLTPVATDLLITEIARDLNFEVVEIVVARQLTRRGLAFPYGRESIIYLKKKKNTFQANNLLLNNEALPVYGQTYHLGGL
jgi:hypothetical protein